MRFLWRGWRQHWGKVITLLLLFLALTVLWWALPVRPRAETAFVDCFDFAVSPDQRWLAVLGWRGPVPLPRCGPLSVVDLTTGREVTSVLDQQTIVAYHLFSSDGRVLAIEDQDGCITIWDVPSGELQGSLTTTPHGDHAFRAYRNFRIMPGRHVVAYQRFDARALVLWDTDTGRELSTISGATTPFEFSPDGKLLAAAALDGSLRLWEVATCQERARLPSCCEFGGPQFSPDGRLLAFLLTPLSPKDDPTMADELCLWDVTLGREQVKLPLQDGSQLLKTGVQFSPNGEHLFAGAFVKRGLWALNSTPPRDLLATLLGDIGGRVTCPLFSPDGSRVAFPLPGLRQIRLFDAASLEPVITLQIPEGYEVESGIPHFTPDGQYLAVTTGTKANRSVWDDARKWLFNKIGLPIQQATRDADPRSVKLFDARTGRDYTQVPGGGLVTIGPDSKTIISCRRENEFLRNGARVHLSVQIWDLPPRKPLGWFLGLAGLLLLLTLGGFWWQTRRRKLKAAARTETIPCGTTTV